MLSQRQQAHPLLVKEGQGGRPGEMVTFRHRVTDEILPHNPPGSTIVAIKDTGGVGVEATTEGEGDMEEATVVVVEEGDMMEEDIPVDSHPATPAGPILVEGVEDTEKDLTSMRRVSMVSFNLTPDGKRSSLNQMDTTRKASILTNMMIFLWKLLGRMFLSL